MSTYYLSVVNPHLRQAPGLSLYVSWVLRLLLVLFFLQAASVSDLWAREARAKPKPVPASREILFSGEDWKLGAFAFDEGERRGTYALKFDDSEFRTVKVPGEVQLHQRNPDLGLWRSDPGNSFQFS